MGTRAGPRTPPPCRVCGSKLRQRDRFCSFCGTPVVAEAPTTLAVHPATVAPASASLQVGEQKAFALEEQRKLITILFIDLQGSTPLAERLDPEDLRTVLNAYFGTVSRHIQHLGGTIDKYIGDAVMAVFGAPISHEDDAQRAITAALAIKADMAKENQRLVSAHGVELVLRTGVNTGEVVAGMLSGQVQAAYTVTGDAVNTAQRLESAAPPNEVLVSESTYALARHAFVFETMPPLTLKGKSAPVAAYRVVGRERRTSPRGGPTLVGRTRELDRLYGAFREASAGRGQVLHLYGEAGVGKTRLASEFLTGLGSTVMRIRTHCSSYEIATPYALVADFIRRVFHIEPTDGEPVASRALAEGLAPLHLRSAESAVALSLELLGYGQRSTLDPESKRRQLLSVLRQYLGHMSSAGAFAVTFEDVHWIDPASASLLADLTRDISGLRCLVMSTSRDEKALTPTAATLALDALDPADANQMMDRVATTPLDDSVRALILERTGGNPFFIEEVVRALASGKTASVPATVQDVLEARFDGLDESPRRVAQRASVIGRTFWLRILARVTAGEPLESGLATLEQERFISARETESEPTFAFRHALVQEVVYGTQLVAQRRTAHSAVGAAIEEHFGERVDEFMDALAFHYDRSDNNAKALHWLVRAGDRAKALFANQEALALFRAALRRARDGIGAIDAPAILERIGEVQTVSGAYDDAIASFGEALDRTSDPSRTMLARLRRKSGVALTAKGAYPAALAAFDEGLAAIESRDDIEAARILLESGQLRWRRGDHAAAREALSEAVEIGERLRDDAVVAEALRHLGNVANFGESEFRAAVEYWRRAGKLYEKLEDLAGIAEVRSNLGIAYRRLGMWDDARAEYEAGLALRERVGNPWKIGMSHNNIGDFHRLRGEPQFAIASFERALAIFEGIGTEVEAAGALMNLGAARAEAGDVEGGRRSLLESEARFNRIGKTQYLPSLYRYLASAELAAGDVDAAERSATRSLELAEAARSPHLVAMARRVLGEIALARGQREEARALLEQSREVLVRIGETTELARTEAALAKIRG